MEWLLLLHQVPPAPAYLRAKILRKLNQFGAYALKNSAYVLPDSSEHVEDFQWIRTEVEHEGGEAWLLRVEALGGLSDESLKDSFRGLRAPDYKQLSDAAGELLQSVRETEDEGRESYYPAWRKLKRRFDEIRRVDFFDATGREEVENIMGNIETAIRSENRRAAAKPELKNLSRKTWVTRRGVKVDRISTAWLIRRFVDPEAHFEYVDPTPHAPAGGQIRFDMFEGEFTHEGDLCTFEVLLRHIGLDDPALAAIAKIVHDIDLKAETHERPETSGFAAMITGITALHSEDEVRIEEGARVLDTMYAALRVHRKDES